ncbi:hypothetical protein D2V93_05575 [Flagellimonas taeanensis]|uniref:DUF6544 family protein n=1 Tax=Flavobacteriaceae TaxID=49546 RepID=UPI000E68D395|nr:MULTISPECIES: DUF6544 family protein [Allomuricauda]MDC6386542.1 hypothetical protein [Muricauda sp. SK9]RIV52117.1 hypothetical protein D2V93_05575 [Allomuricauda taeanensis]
MRTAFTILILLHGAIHLLGFFKAFGILEFEGIHQSVSKTSGMLWLLAFLLFVLTVILLNVHSAYWWSIGFLAVALSQVLVFNHWSDAKWGTIANLIILSSALIAYSTFSFKEKVVQERTELLKNSRTIGRKAITEEEISHLPEVVQKWLTTIGTLGKEPISNVHLIQELQLRTSPDQENWSTGKAEQYFTVDPPAFNWDIDAKINFLPVVGRDQLVDGHGEMTIKLLGLIPMANAENSEKIDKATLQRYLAEIVWFPTAALGNHIRWKQLDGQSAEATLNVNGMEGSGVFHFDETGIFQKFTAYRYKDTKDKTPRLWTVSAIRTEERNGIQIPVELDADWELDEGKWTWLKLKIERIEYNIDVP